MAHRKCRKRRPIVGRANVGCSKRWIISTDHVAERKVGCDRALPECLNCKKGQRFCQGYGLRLAWPDKQDGRRKQKRYEVQYQATVTKYLPRKDGNLQFLNTVIGDLNGSRLSFRELTQGDFIKVMWNIPMPLDFCSINEQDGMLLSHCKPSKCDRGLTLLKCFR